MAKAKTKKTRGRLLGPWPAWPTERAAPAPDNDEGPARITGTDDELARRARAAGVPEARVAAYIRGIRAAEDNAEALAAELANDKHAAEVLAQVRDEVAVGDMDEEGFDDYETG